MRLIDADALEKVYLRNSITDTATIGEKTVLRHLREAPAIDAVPVVRCKDCKHWYDEEGVCLKIYSDGSVSPYAWQFRNEDDFCSYGERRSDD